MAKKSETIKVRAHERTLADGTQVTVAGYERMKSTQDQREWHPGNIDTMKAGGKSDKIITRDPDRHGKVQGTQGVQVLGRPGITKGVTRVSR